VGTNPTVLATNANFQVEGTTTAEQFVVLKNGNVGIGTTTPSEKVHVKSGSINESGLRLEQLNLSTPATIASVPLGIDATGKVVVAPPIDLYRDRGMPNTLMTLSGVATFSRTNFFSWTNRFMIIGGGRGKGTISSRGFYDIIMPPVGTVIPGVALAQDITVTAAGINMRDIFNIWSTLYYILPTGNDLSVPTNFRLVGYQSDFVVPDNWVMVANYNADALTIKIGNGQILKQGTDSNGSITPFDATIDFNVNTNPNTAGTTFSPNTPVSGAVLYISTIDGSQWTYNGTTYVTAPFSADWKTTGNASTVQGTNFVGTTDNVGLSIRTNNVIRQTIDAAGNVGIGTTAPTNRLTVAGFGFNPTVNDLAAIKVDGGYGGGIVFSEGANRSSIYSYNGSTLVFTTGGSASGLPEKMRIDATGNLGIGTTIPTQKLDVVGNVKFSGALMPNNNAGTAGQVLTSAGAGIAPTWAVNSNLYTTDGTLAANRTVTQGANNLNFTGTGFTTFTSGNVGIGISSPTQKLDVAGNVKFSGALMPDNNAGTAGQILTSAGAGIAPTWATNTAVSSNLYTADGTIAANRTVTQGANSLNFTGTGFTTFTGNVGVGTTTPTNRLSVAGFGFDPTVNDRAAIKVEGGYGGGIVFSEGANRSSIYSRSGSVLVFTTGGSASGLPEKMRITETGNVGIGTVSPSSTLDVSGTIRAIGNITNGGMDFILGNTDQASRGSSGTSRALVKDLNSVLSINHANDFSGGTKIGGANVTIPGNVAIGTTAPTSKLQVVGLPIHASNAAATTAGLTAGAFYHNGDGILRVVF
jgi:hypothetical protein